VTQTVFPTFRYRDAPAAIRWLKETLGFEELHVYEGEGEGIDHAELVIAGNVIMLGSDRSEHEERSATARSVTYVALDEVDALHERARAAGGSPSELKDQDYGSRDFSIEDPEGNTWSFGTYRPKLDS
jgi:uncharacterized glyoxalase superfamily protein PhnB